ncbi:acyltransferase Pun1-like [Cornus florida]|uniref:acyltransferase Pun1-like n=1 Tax=Cornus florida TaxID=4283 RepID=UPI0028A24B15|nr:acyltransferase Pun1-like [Cornus florida]XP_059633591.1 acyltransferase Pun1-like [Cornus florida]XP_059633592.1 acyltransferase Pun1-like [Cornus florida]
MEELGTVQAKIISREIIKPSCPTPPHLRNYKLSSLDQLTNRNYIPRVLFYSNNINYCDSPHNTTANNKSHQLKKSLSETLTLYYPFAGILKGDGISVDCNDEGVDFLEAQIHCQLSDILKPPKLEALHLVLPSGLLLGNNSYKGGSLVVIQFSHFTCGGMAIGMCMSHKIADGCNMGTFLNDWAAMARQSIVLSPHFITVSAMSSVPPPGDPFIVPEVEIGKEARVTRRFVFEPSKLAELKAMITSESAEIENPTRVEAVTALLYKCAMTASKANSVPFTLRSSILSQLLNMRPKMVPPLQENSVGNLVWYFTISVTDEKDVNLHGLVGQLRKNRTEFYNKYAKNVTVNEWFIVSRKLLRDLKELFESNNSTNNVDFYVSSSMCRFPFYKVDFGWGKPIWVSTAGGNVFENKFVLMDSNREGGIEAWVSLGEMEMRAFERDEELLSFAQFNPSVLD